MDDSSRNQLQPGVRVKVIQQIAARDHAWTSEVRGTIVKYMQRPTGSWFAHAKDDKLWLDRLVLRRDDGEITTLVLDQYTRLEIEAQAPSEAQSEPAPA